jgi:hypothetical protein
MPPLILASVLAFFLNDADEGVREAAKSSLLGMPPGLVQKIVADQVHPKALAFFAAEHAHSDPVIEGVLLNKITFDETFVFLAAKVSERMAAIVAGNQVRLLRTPAIAEALRKNPNALKSDVDRVVSFLKINGILLEGESPELTHQEIQEILNAPEPVQMGEEEEIPGDLPEELVEEDEEEYEEEPAKREEKKKNVAQLILSLNVSQKVKLALSGNKEARSILIKDSNKIVATNVVKSPRITDGEVIAFSQMRTIYDEVIRLIAQDPHYMRNYNIQLALVNNPKTPFPVALKIMRQLHIGDLAALVKNKNVTQQLAKMAKTLWEQKRT